MTTPPNLPANKPISEAPTPPGWVGLGYGAPLKTYTKWWCFYTEPPSWVFTTAFTDQGRVNKGIQTYVNPSSVRAHLSVLPGVVAKYWRRLWAKKVVLTKG